MARGYSQILTSIWEDKDFTALTEQQQRLYLFLISQPNLNHAGLLPLTLQRWSKAVPRLTEGNLRTMLDSLEASGFAVVDHADDELFVCGYFRHANIGGQPRVVAAAYDAIVSSASFALRAVASIELSEAVAKTPAPATPTGLRAQVLERDGWQCRNCGWSPGGPVPNAASGRPLYRGLELDHIHPKSLGGPNTLENFQVLCTTCNTRKGARV